MGLPGASKRRVSAVPKAIARQKFRKFRTSRSSQCGGPGELQVDNVSLTLDNGYILPGYQTPCYTKATYAYSYVDRNWNDTLHSVDETSECTATNASSLVGALLPLGALRVLGPEDRLGRLYAQAYGVQVIFDPNASGDDAYLATGTLCAKDYCPLVTQ